MKRSFTISGAICDKCGYKNDFSALKCPCGNRLRYSDEENYKRMTISQKRVTKIIDILGSFWVSGYGFFVLMCVHALFILSILFNFYAAIFPLGIVASETIILSLIVAALIILLDEAATKSFFYYFFGLLVRLIIFNFVLVFLYDWYQRAVSLL